LPARSARSPTIWFETGDLFVHFNWNLHPTGIQRVGLEILRAARENSGERVAFCRLSRYTGRFEPIDFARIAAASAAPEFGEPASGRFERPIAVTRQVWRFLRRYPKTVCLDYLRGRSGERAFAARIAPDDMVVCLGLPWGSPSYGSWISNAKRRYGIRFALLIHDVIPFTHVELCQRQFAAGFRRWFENVIGVCDLVFVSSEYCRDTIRSLCDERGWPSPPIERIPFGAGFTMTASADDRAAIDWPRRFVLLVSSIDRRKNHALLLRVWRALLLRHGAEEVPSLVFLGVGGDLVDYIDPENDADALDAIERALFEPGYLAAHTARIDRDYRAPTWSECATMLVDKIDALGAPARISAIVRV
jgi:glycosyltransferase involved in cell wall biosynthesis